jgi:hypothetical protein
VISLLTIGHFGSLDITSVILSQWVRSRQGDGYGNVPSQAKSVAAIRDSGLIEDGDADGTLFRIFNHASQESL